MKLLKMMVASVFLWISALTVAAQRPAWIGNTPIPQNDTYRFVEVISYGTTLEEARLNAKMDIADNRQLQEGVRVNMKTHDKILLDKQRVDGGRLHEDERQLTDIDLDIDGDTFTMKARKVDEYPEYKNGRTTLHTLYQVAICAVPDFDDTYVTERYGVCPCLYSVVPGLGQIYKGSVIKGVTLFTAEAVGIAGILICENQRSNYMTKIKEQPQYTQEYKSKADDWATRRNICIGVSAAIWVYNVIDAAMTKGRRRVIVRKRNKGGWAFIPYMDENGSAGVNFCYKF